MSVLDEHRPEGVRRDDEQPILLRIAVSRRFTKLLKAIMKADKAQKLLKGTRDKTGDTYQKRFDKWQRAQDLYEGELDDWLYVWGYVGAEDGTDDDPIHPEDIEIYNEARRVMDQCARDLGAGGAQYRAQKMRELEKMRAMPRKRLAARPAKKLPPLDIAPTHPMYVTMAPAYELVKEGSQWWMYYLGPNKDGQPERTFLIKLPTKKAGEKLEEWLKHGNKQNFIEYIHRMAKKAQAERISDPLGHAVQVLGDVVGRLERVAGEQRKRWVGKGREDVLESLRRDYGKLSYDAPATKDEATIRAIESYKGLQPRNWVKRIVMGNGYTAAATEKLLKEHYDAPSVKELEDKSKAGEVIALTGPGSLSEAIEAERKPKAKATKSRATKAKPEPKAKTGVPLVAAEKWNPAQRAKVAKRLLATAARYKKAGDEILGEDRQMNTPKRLRDAMGARSKGAYKVFMSEVLTRVAAEVAKGADTAFGRVKSVTQLEDLNAMLASAQHKRMLKQNISGDRADMPMGPEDVPFAVWRGVFMYNLENLDDVLDAAKGLKGVCDAKHELRAWLKGARALEKSVGNNWKGTSLDPHAQRAWRELVAAFKKAKLEMPWAGQSMVDNLKVIDRMAKLGITDAKTLRVALDEYFTCCRMPGMVKPVDTVAKREAELNMLKIPGYWPTPTAVVERMVAAAKIEPGDLVLEPSAGSGSIAQVIRDKHPGATLELLELNYSLAELLKLKGFKVSGSDFMEYRKTQKLRGYTRPFIGVERIHPHFHQDAATMRLSASGIRCDLIEPIEGLFGEPEFQMERRLNTLGVPKSMRGSVVPDGKVFTRFDFSQQELRIIAYMSGDVSMIAA
ncbi:MAG: hypothetical protein IIB19_05335, partial [Chloroflexi bacterium]|nr:hypothetical protein [Chloroflexota bacterium]